MAGYSEPDDMALKQAGNEVHAHLKALHSITTGTPPDWAGHEWSVRMQEAAFGLYLFGDGPNTLSDDEVRALIPQAEGARKIIQAILKDLNG